MGRTLLTSGVKLMTIRVECYAGYRGEQEPLAFWLGERRLAVRAVVNRWFAPTQRWFKVDTDDGNMHVVRHDEASGDWEIAAYGAPQSDVARARCRDRSEVHVTQVGQGKYGAQGTGRQLVERGRPSKC